jgi:sugar/nucleoside kinase (ribokinase family)
MTTDNSACSTVDATFVATAAKEFERFDGKGIALAAPEVPMPARAALLELATRHHFFRVASFTSQELGDMRGFSVLENVDLLCINLDEARSALRGSVTDDDPHAVAEQSIRLFTSANPKILVSITHGKQGSYVWDGSAITHVPAPLVEVVSTAGAGDAFTSGLIAGIVHGLSLKEAQQFATLAGSYSVTSPDTIHKGLNRSELLGLARHAGVRLTPKVLQLLEEEQ